MPFTGKATYSAGATLPEIAEDVSDLIAISSPHETPLLDALGESTRFARSTVHEWLEDSLVANRVVVASVINATTITVDDAAVLLAGDQLRVADATERVLVTAVNRANEQVTIARGYGGSPGATIAAETPLHVIGNAALEGDDAPSARFTARTRQANWTQIFAATCEVSGSELAVRQLGVRDELDYHYLRVQRPRRAWSLRRLIRAASALARFLSLVGSAVALLRGCGWSSEDRPAH